MLFAAITTYAAIGMGVMAYSAHVDPGGLDEIVFELWGHAPNHPKAERDRWVIAGIVISICPVPALMWSMGR